MKRELMIGIGMYLLLLVITVPLMALLSLLIKQPDHSHTVIVVALLATTFFIGPVIEETAKMLALQKIKLKHFPLLMGVLEFLQYVIIANANPWLRVPALLMHYYTGEIHRRFSSRPLKGLLITVGIHQLFNMTISTVLFVIFKYIM